MKIGVCSLFHGDVDSARRVNPKRPCTACGKPIGPRRFRWCSDACGRWWSINHNFGDARDHIQIRSQVWSFDVGPRGGIKNKRLVGFVCEMCQGIVDRIEVDHVEAAMGRHGKKDCIHHIDNLRALCIPHHKERTKEQAGLRRTAR